MICIYVGVGCVIYSIFTIQHPKGPEYTIPISPTMQCVINLTFQFFFVYIWIWVAITVKEFTGFGVGAFDADYGELQGCRDVLPNAGYPFCGHSYACIDAYQLEGRSSRLVPGWHVHG